jgi:hypothetical protein
MYTPVRVQERLELFSCQVTFQNAVDVGIEVKNGRNALLMLAHDGLLLLL